MLLGLHTYSLYLHGIGQAWADFKLPWARQLTTFDLFELTVELGLDGLHLDDGVLETLDTAYLQEVGAAAVERSLVRALLNFGIPESCTSLSLGCAKLSAGILCCQGKPSQ